LLIGILIMLCWSIACAAIVHAGSTTDLHGCMILLPWADAKLGIKALPVLTFRYDSIRWKCISIHKAVVTTITLKHWWFTLVRLHSGAVHVRNARQQLRPVESDVLTMPVSLRPHVLLLPLQASPMPRWKQCDARCSRMWGGQCVRPIHVLWRQAAGTKAAAHVRCLFISRGAPNAHLKMIVFCLCLLPVLKERLWKLCLLPKLCYVLRCWVEEKAMKESWNFFCKHIE